jgi:16S rRNA (guanine966-N2)-methyltransferase
MRVIAGEFKGRRLVAPRGWQVRPTSDRVREAVFSALGDVEGLTVLDLFCGTGALAIEALSRGAARATLVDRDTRAALGNVHALGLTDRAELIKADVVPWVGRSQGGDRDLIFCDPPYRLADRLGQQLDSHLPALLSDEGRLVVESAARSPLEISSLQLLRRRRYGATDVAFYRKGRE